MKLQVTQSERELVDRFMNYDRKNFSYKQLTELLKSNKWTITDERVVKSDGSPTGKTYIGISKQPLQSVKNGHGWYGVVSQTDNREFVQCHVCGKWLRRLSEGHLRLHKLTTLEYKRKFGLLKGTTLEPDALSYTREEIGRKHMTEKMKDPKFRAKRLAALAKATKSNYGNKYSTDKVGVAQHDNAYGLCEKQVGYRIAEYVKKYKFLPTGSVKGEGDVIVNALKKRYGSRNLGFIHYGLPTFHKIGSNVQMIAPNGKTLRFGFLQRSYSKEKVYNWILKNTPALSAKNIKKFKDA